MPKVALQPEQNDANAQYFAIKSRWVMVDDCRFDAKTYADEGYEALRILETSGCETRKLETFVGRVYHPTESQPRSNFKRIWVGPGEGLPFLTGKQLFYFRPDREKFISERMRKLHELRVPKDTILLSRSGTTGFPVLVSEWLSRFAVTDDAIRIFPGSRRIGFVYAYLASSIGRPLLTRNEYGSTVSHLEAKHVKAVPIPIIASDKEEWIDTEIRRAYALRDQANFLLDDAEKVLYDRLGLTPFTDDDIEYFGSPSDPRAFVVKLSDLEARFDATNHVPVVRSAVHKLGQARYPLVEIDSLCNEIRIPARFKRKYAEVADGIPYLMPSQLVAMRPYGMKALSKRQAGESPEYLLKPGELLLSTDGTVGRVHPVTSRMVGWFGSNNIARLSDSDTNIWFLYAFLSTLYGRHQIKKDIYGGVIDHISEVHIKSVLCPKVPQPIQAEIGDIVKQAFDLKDEAERIEDSAIAELELRIRKR